MFILAPNDTALQANSIDKEATKILNAVLDLNATAENDPANHKAVQDKAGQLVNYIVNGHHMEGFISSLLVDMRRDLEVPNN
jgi:hypothetical protein